MDAEQASLRRKIADHEQGLRSRGAAGQCDLACRRAQNPASFWMAFRLIYFAYVRSGLAQPNPFGIRFLPHHLLTTSFVLLAARRELDVGTLSIIEDGEFGMPLDLLYPQDIARLRRGGTKVAELTCLAAETTEHRLRWSILRVLLRSALELAAARRIEVLTVCIHPRHARFYEDRLGFVQLGPSRNCPWVCGQPAIAMYRSLSAERNEKTLADETEPAVIPLRDATMDVPGDDGREYFRQLLPHASPFPWPLRRIAAA
jgi:hypothetical protein